MRRSVRLIADEIQRYAVTHPDARDTVDGIVWWVHMQREQDIRNDIAAAIEWLVKRGELVRFDLPDGSRAFGRRLPDGTGEPE